MLPKFICLLSIFFVYIAAICSYIQPVRDKECKFCFSLAKGTFCTLKKERANIEKSAVITFWIAERQFSVDETGNMLLFNNKNVSGLRFTIA